MPDINDGGTEAFDAARPPERKDAVGSRLPGDTLNCAVKKTSKGAFF